jgi:ribosome biogenesis protein BMS1
LPTAESEKRRKLSDKNRLVHAPFSGGAAGLLGGSGAVSFEGDRVWVNTAGNFTRKTGEEAVGEIGEGEQMVMDMQDVDYTLGDKIGTSQLRLFANDAAPLALPEQGSSTGGRRRRLAFDEDEMRDEHDGAEVSDVSDDEEGSDLDPDEDEEGPALLNNRDRDDVDGKVAYDDSDSEVELDEDGEGVGFEQADAGADIQDYEEDNLLGEDDEDDEGPQWKRNLAEQARRNFAESSAKSRPNLMTLIYNSTLTPVEIYRQQINAATDVGLTAEVDGEDADDDLFQLARTSKAALEEDEEDRFRPVRKVKALDWEDEDLVESFRRFFVSGQHFDAEEDGEAGGDKGFEDLEAEGAGDDEEGDENEDNVKPAQTSEDALAAKKEKLKRRFNAEYDGSSDEEDGKDFYSEQKDEIRKRLEATQAEFAGDDPETRALVEGYRPGAYVRLEFANVPSELLDNFNPRFPLVVGALLPHEENFGFVQVRVKKHRWHPKILKTNDPLIFSIGWRRFQTVPIYSLDDGTRNRMLKYTPEHMHCLATFYGPISSPGTGFCAFNTIGNEKASFRISATGVVTDIDGSSRITKKLKLTGVPRRLTPASSHTFMS